MAVVAAAAVTMVATAAAAAAAVVVVLIVKDKQIINAKYLFSLQVYFVVFFFLFPFLISFLLFRISMLRSKTCAFVLALYNCALLYVWQFWLFRLCFSFAFLRFAIQRYLFCFVLSLSNSHSQATYTAQTHTYTQIHPQWHNFFSFFLSLSLNFVYYFELKFLRLYCDILLLNILNSVVSCYFFAVLSFCAGWQINKMYFYYTQQQKKNTHTHNKNINAWNCCVIFFVCGR